MIINANTRISAILNASEQALEAIVSINHHFIKLRNPFLRKLMAGRTTLAMASKIGGCKVEDFYKKLAPLGFEAEDQEAASEDEFLTAACHEKIIEKEIIELDVRPILNSGMDPLKTILQKVKLIDEDHVLKIINNFVPGPLISVLKDRGIEACSSRQGQTIITYFFRKEKHELNFRLEKKDDDWFEKIMFYKGRITEIDVRGLQMPQPMREILTSLECLKPGHALFVFHQRVPVFLLPELDQRGFTFRIHEIPNGEFFILIFRKNDP